METNYHEKKIIIVEMLLFSLNLSEMMDRLSRLQQMHFWEPKNRIADDMINNIHRLDE